MKADHANESEPDIDTRAARVETTENGRPVKHRNTLGLR
jgi:hypothetical protein